MISIICFEKDLLMPREEAEDLNLKYQSDIKIGYDYNNKLEPMTSSWDVYKEDCIKKDDKYYKSEEGIEENKPVDNYYLYTKYTGNVDYVLVKQDNHLVDLLTFASKCKYKFYIKESIKSQEPTVNNINVILSTLKEKATNLTKLVDKIKDNTFNSKTNVHVGGGLITTYNDLMLKENTCTDELQSELNNGWRIIAVCVQPDQRRPDYILGRYNPSLDVYNKPSADR